MSAEKVAPVQPEAVASPYASPDGSVPDGPLRKSFLDGHLTGWTLDMPPRLRYMVFAFFPFYLSLIPVARLLTRPSGAFTLLLNKIYGPRDTSSIILIIGLGAFNTYVFSAVGSVWGQALHPRGYQNYNPRLVKNELRGFAHRLTSAHQSLIEVFPMFGITGALVLATRTSGVVAPSMSLIDGLFLHFFLKHILFLICYYADDDFNRSGAHVFSISTLLSVLFELYRSF